MNVLSFWVLSGALVSWSGWGRKMVQNIQTSLLFSAHISYGKGKYLNQTVFLQNLPRIIVYVIWRSTFTEFNWHKFSSMRYVFVKIFALKTILLLKWFGAENIPLVRGRLVFSILNVQPMFSSKSWLRKQEHLSYFYICNHKWLYSIWKWALFFSELTSWFQFFLKNPWKLLWAPRAKNI